jgi:hypothetical protein
MWEHSQAFHKKTLKLKLMSICGFFRTHYEHNVNEIKHNFFLAIFLNLEK